MKRLLILLACVASLCACTNPNMKRAKELIAEYDQKYEATLDELVDLEVPLSADENAFFNAYAELWSYRTMIVVGENWNLDVSALRHEEGVLTAQVEMLKVPLTPEQDRYLHKFTEANMYLVTKKILLKWVEIHS